jgi:hypothetical protein
MMHAFKNKNKKNIKTRLLDYLNHTVCYNKLSYIETNLNSWGK